MKLLEKLALKYISKKGLIPPEVSSMLQFMGINTPAYIEDNFENYINNCYAVNHDLYSVINLITSKASIVPYCIEEPNDVNSYEKYKSLSWSDPRKMALRKKAIKEVKIDSLSNVLKRPNPLQTLELFIENVLGFKLLTGNSYLYGIRLEAGNNKGKIKEAWVLPSQHMQIIPESYPNGNLEYRLNLGKITDIPSENICHLKYWNPLWVGNQWVYGFSPLKAGLGLLTKSNDANKASTNAFKNMGAVGMLTGDAKTVDQQLTAEQAEGIKKTWRKKYAGSKNFNDILITSANLKWTQFGMSPVDLNIIESEKMNLRSICNLYNVNSALLNDPENKTYNNLKEAKKALYVDVILPELFDLFSNLLNFIDPEIAKAGYIIEPDISEIPDMQEDYSLLVGQLSQAWWLTGNEKREAMNYEPIESPVMDEVLLPSTLIPATLNNTDYENI